MAGKVLILGGLGSIVGTIASQLARKGYPLRLVGRDMGRLQEIAEDAECICLTVMSGQLAAPGLMGNVARWVMR